MRKQVGFAIQTINKQSLEKMEKVLSLCMISLNTLSQLAEIDLLSQEKPVVIFKHSTRCSISSMVFNRFEKNYKTQNQDQLPVYYLDLLSYRNISNEIASKYGVEHQSPQTLLIKNGKCIHDASHTDIELSEIIEFAN